MEEERAGWRCGDGGNDWKLLLTSPRKIDCRGRGYKERREERTLMTSTANPLQCSRTTSCRHREAPENPASSSSPRLSEAVRRGRTRAQGKRTSSSRLSSLRSVPSAHTSPCVRTSCHLNPTWMPPSLAESPLNTREPQQRRGSRLDRFLLLSTSPPLDPKRQRRTTDGERDTTVMETRWTSKTSWARRRQRR